ncbi:hypothetical protein PHMEG_00023389 [Phytophthora megakarya]|uniref:Uncharacterized protein n=1 Tax=Phytophthora megakarya TaxID=4795 RepID=A0A225VJH8_9STRA|nr:hypothetical protein PHMEG_00023389 [Phytophthora megakarya]
MCTKSSRTGPCKLQNGGPETPDFVTVAPVAPDPSSWAELGSMTRSFVDYCRVMCDSTTVQVAEALDQLISTMEGWKQCEIADLPILVRWIDSLLKHYRDAATQDIFHLTSTRAVAPSWFSISNPELHSLMITALAGRLRSAEVRTAGANPAPTRETIRSSFDRKIPSDVASEIPTQNGKEVCHYFLSKRGCKSQDPSKCTFKNRVHFWPDVITSRLRKYISSHLGGLRKPFQEA